MALESLTPTTRRNVLAAGAGALAAFAAQAIGRPLSARAVNGDPVLAGNVEDASATTGVTTTAGNGLQGVSSASGASGVYGQNDGGGYGVAGRSTGTGVFGHSTAITDFGFGVYGLCEGGGIAVKGVSTDGVGVHGESSSDVGVSGQSTSSFGVSGSSTSSMGVIAFSATSVGLHAGNWSSSLPALQAQSGGDSTGVQGYSGSGSPPAAPTKTGVYGYAAQAANSRGVFGQTTVGRGVEGRATSGFGMFAQATTGQALQAGATTGTGVYAFADANGTALRAARGHVRFSTSGLATIAAGSDSVTVTPGFDISASSKVLAVPQGALPAGVTLAYVTRDTVNDQFTIRLSGNATVATPVAWFVIS